MTTQLHERSMHIDAPLEMVFDYVKDPHHFFEAFPEKDRAHMALAEVNLTSDGIGSTYRVMGRMFFLFHMEYVATRTEYVPNQRIVDTVNAGGVWTYTFEPDGTGTTLSIGFGWTEKWPRPAAVLMDRMSWDGDHDLDLMLASIKKAIET
jgi:uncharacterized protein YndB with AHSA1/START domain